MPLNRTILKQARKVFDIKTEETLYLKKNNMFLRKVDFKMTDFALHSLKIGTTFSNCLPLLLTIQACKPFPFKQCYNSQSL